MTQRRDVEFEVEGGEHVRGWLFAPDGATGPLPAISMAHGYAGVKEQGIEPFARAFAEAGFVALLHDHCNFGANAGAIRSYPDSLLAIAYWRQAGTFFEGRAGGDSVRGGAWGTAH